MQELERRRRREPGDLAAVETLQNRLEEMGAHGRLSAMCAEVAGDDLYPKDVRDDARRLAYIFRPAGPDGQAQIVAEGEALLIELPEHSWAAGVRGQLFSAGLRPGFDFPAKTTACVARLTEAARTLQHPEALLTHARGLDEECREWCERLWQWRRRQGDEAQPGFAAELGDAETTIRVFGAPPYDARPECQRLVAEAREKLRRMRP